jgi:hypothetical protein
MFQRNHRTRRLLAPVAAVAALLAAVTGITAESASAAGFSDGSYATLSVNCLTQFNFAAKTETRSNSIYVVASSPGIWMQTRTYANGQLVGSTGWTQQAQGGVKTWGQGFVNALNAPDTTISVLVQFAKIVHGQWQYSPNGRFEYASHSRTVSSILGTFGEYSDASSCHLG